MRLIDISGDNQDTFVNPEYVTHIYGVKKGDSVFSSLSGKAYTNIVMTNGIQIAVDEASVAQVVMKILELK